MSRRLIDKARRRLAAETGGRVHPPGGRLRVALVFPNTYHHAMSNLGFLSVFRLINDRSDALCERFFLPDPEDLAEHRKTGYPLFSLESGSFLADFDLVAFSLSFENDFLHLPVLFELAQLPLWRRERGERHPLVIAGGVCAFLNPEPVSEIIDLFAVGEGEVLLPPLLDALVAPGEAGREALLADLARLPGIYVPSLYRVEAHPDGRIAGYRPLPGAPPRVRRQWVRDLPSESALAPVQTADTEFGDMSLVEVSRGCSRGCRFCAAGFLYLPERERSLETLTPVFAEGLSRREKIGLVGAAVGDHSELPGLYGAVVAGGGRVSVASLRIDALTQEEVRLLKESGHRTVALAPEAGSQRLRNLINKGLDEEQILQAAALVAEEGIVNLKLYFLIGLPTEEDRDIEDLLALVARVREAWLAGQKSHGRLGNLTLSVNPFIPKPFTPLQWAPMATEQVLSSRIRRIRGAVARMANTHAIFESLRAALLQGLFSRGDRWVAQLLPDLAAGSNLKAAARRAGLDPAWYLHRERTADEIFPWEVLDSGVERSYLWREYQAALDGRLTPRCHPGCRRCGVCL